MWILGLKGLREPWKTPSIHPRQVDFLVRPEFVNPVSLVDLIVIKHQTSVVQKELIGTTVLEALPCKKINPNKPITVRCILC